MISKCQILSKCVCVDAKNVSLFALTQEIILMIAIAKPIIVVKILVNFAMEKGYALYLWAILGHINAIK